jgi:hypothetical protein
MFVKNLNLNAKKEGSLSKKGVDVSFGARDLSSISTLAGGHTGANITDGRLKLNLEIDTRGNTPLLDKVDTYAHEALYHGWVAESSFLNSGALPQSLGTHSDFDLVYQSPHWSHGTHILNEAFDIMNSMELSYNSQRSFMDIWRSGYGWPRRQR